MAVLKPRRTERVAPRVGADRPIQRPQRTMQEEVPIHTMQRPEIRTRPLDTRPRDISRPPYQERPVSKGWLSPRMLVIGAVVALMCAALVYVLVKSDSTTVVEQKPAAEQTPVTETELKQTTTPEQAAQAETIIKGLAKHILLPEQTPQVMQIMNPDELIQKDPFFAGSQSGDVLLIYKTVGKAIIYSPGRDIIVNVGPVQVEAPRAEPTQ
jgi:hypothetical protein